MLPKNARLTISADFARATKSGTRVTTENFVGYLYISPVTNNDHPKCGLIVNKGVGGSVARHTLARKVRHAVAPQLTKLPTGSLLVIRALAKNKVDATAVEVEKLINKLLERSSRAVVK
ncbi:RnpA RNase P protein component [Candidatus Nanopelagicaceae bacterium]